MDVSVICVDSLAWLSYNRTVKLITQRDILFITSMKFIVSFVFISLLFSSFNTYSQVVELKVIKGVPSQKPSIDYFHQILIEALALNKDGFDYELTPVDFEFSQNRTLRLLNYYDVLDITFSMTSVSRETDYIAIKVPLLDGLYGKRKLLVNPDNKSKFENMSLDKLKQQVACQGMHWPDYKKLKLNGFSVYGVDDYESNFKMLAKGRCDYFPRGIAEISSDLDKFNGKYGQMEMVDNILLVYDAPIYFFVGKHQQELADIVTAGLSELQKTGRLKQALLQNNIFNYDPKLEMAPNLKVYKLH